MDFENRVLEKLDKIQEDVTDLKVENAMQTKDIARNTIDLTEHKEGVQQNRQRIQCLEDKAKPLTIRQLATKVVLFAGSVGTIAGAIWVIIRIMDL